jgi:hypothetical protein
MFRKFRTTAAQRRSTNRIGSSRFETARLWLTALERREVPATFTVTLLGDTGGAGGVADGSDTTGFSGDLRYVITQANAKAGPDTIVFGPAFAGATTITLADANGQISITQPLTIIGTGKGLLTLRGPVTPSATSRVFNITDSATTSMAVTISDLTIANTKLSTGNGAAILSSNESLNLTNVAFNQNSAQAGSGGAIGSASVTSGVTPTITLTNVSFADNFTTSTVSTNGGGAIFLQGAAVVNASSATFTNNQAVVGSTSGGGAIMVTGASTMTFANSTLTGNSAVGSTTATTQYGGAINAGSTLNLTITSSTLSGNKANSIGGAIRVSGATTITVADSTFNANTSGSSGGAIRLASTVTASTFTNTKFTNNIGTSGAAVYTNSGSSTMTFESSTFSGNTATSSHGGAFYVFNTGSSITLTNSSVLNNSATLSGGGFRMWGGNLIVSNSTFFGNTASNSTNGGGAISFGTAGKLDVRNSTIAGNTATNATGAGGGIFATGTVTLNSTIVAGNNTNGAAGPDINFAGTIGGDFNLIGAKDSGGFTLSGTNNLTGTKASPLNAKLGAPANNGGPTLTMLPLPGSPVYDKGSNIAPALANDQRGTGYPRSLQGGPDIGAIESLNLVPSGALTPLGPIVTAGPTPNTVVVTYTDPVTLIDVATIDVNDITIKQGVTSLAITKATPSSGVPASPLSVTYEFTPPATPTAGWDFGDNGNWTVSVVLNEVKNTSNVAVVDGAIGSFNVNIAGVYTVTLTTDNSPTLGGEGSGLSGDLRYVLTKANSSAGTTDTITFDPTAFGSAQTITLGGVELPVIDGVVINGPGADKLTVDAAALSRVFKIDNIVPGVIDVTITGMKISGGSSAGTGGNIFNADEKLTLDSVWVESGLALNGGGLGSSAAANLTIRNSTFSTNSSSISPVGNGGALYIVGSATITIQNSTFSANNAGGVGGALFGTASGASVTIQNSTFTQNGAAGANGGGIYISGGTVGLESSVVAGNTNANTPDFFVGKVNSKNSFIGVADGITTLNNLGGTTNGTLITPADPQLDPVLQINFGGTTPTHKPNQGSPLFNAGSNPAGLTTDQNGQPRTLQGVTDIGSVESIGIVPTAKLTSIPPITVVSTSPNTLVVTYTDDTGFVASSFKTGNVELFDPLNNPITITGISVSPGGSSSPQTVTYTFTIPGGTWDSSDNGVYTIKTTSNPADAVTDTDAVPNTVPGGQLLGTFSVLIPTAYVVDTLGDAGVMTGPTSGDIRYVLTTANSVPGPAVVTFSSLFNTLQTITLTSTLTIEDVTTITGPTGGVVIDGGGAYSILKINTPLDSQTITLENMTLTGGKANVGALGSAIENVDENLFLNNVRIENGTAGPAVYLTGITANLTANQSTFHNNISTSGGGAIRVQPSGGSNVVTLVESTLSNNTSGGTGGAIYFNFGGTLNITRSSLFNNKGASGGAIGLWNATGTITNSTLFGNTATGVGGAIRLASTGAAITINNSTVTGNSGTNGGGIYRSSTAANPGVTLSSTIISKNFGANDVFSASAITTGGDFNFIGAGNANVTFGGTNNKFGADPQLQAVLSNNGGPTLTLLPLPGSPVLLNGFNDPLVTGNVDQRGAGFPRVLTGKTQPNIGAVEGLLVQPVGVLTPLGTISVAGTTPNSVVVTFTSTAPALID